MRKALFFLGIFTDSDIDWLISAGTKREIRSGELLVTEGKQLDSVFLVIDGLFSVTVATIGNKEIDQMRSCEVVGELSFIDSSPPTASVKAIERSFVLAIPRQKLRSKLESDLAFASRFYHAMAIFLADRLRSMRSGTPKYDSSESLNQDMLYQDEIDPEVLDKVSLAGARFDWIQRKLMSA